MIGLPISKLDLKVLKNFSGSPGLVFPNPPVEQMKRMYKKQVEGQSKIEIQPFRLIDGLKE